MHTTSIKGNRELGRRGRRPMRHPEDTFDGDSMTFTSSLAIGPSAPKAPSLANSSNPSTSKDDVSSAPVNPPFDTNGGMRRAARKSKTDALAAIIRAGSPTLDASPSGSRPNSSKSSSVLRPVPMSEELDLSSVPMPIPGRAQPVRQSPRLFGLEEAPSFYPTAKQFSDPMAYISSISSEAEKYGICKIIPPDEWKMPFVTNTKTFRFKTRVQRLNSIEASSRAKLNFLEQLYRFHDQSLNRPTIPTIAHKAVDLWMLRKEVHKRGGYDYVSRNRLWGDIGRAMGYDDNLMGISTQLKNAYSRIIYPFDTFVAQVRSASDPTSATTARTVRYPTRGKMPTSPRRSSSGEPAPTSSASSLSSLSSPTPPSVPSRMRSSSPNNTIGNGKARDTSADSSAMDVDDHGSAISMSLSDDSDRPAPRQFTPVPKASSPSPPTPKSTPRFTTEYAVPQLDESLKGQNCEICREGVDDLQMLLCDGCDRGFHTYCLTPPLSSIPKGQWFCHACLFDTDYGFDEGEDHSLATFQQRAAGFKRLWFDAHPPARLNGSVKRSTSIDPTEDEVENEFWRLIQSPYDSVEVEYGADIHSTTHGSAMPTMETHPLNLYSRDPWNLNNIPILPNSLLRYIKSDISGMTVPWTYVGMVFSTFCWHNEDHYTYSINFMHWGNTKTWYGIPASDAEKFEAAIKSEAPELFEAQPDLLFQLVTLMSPGRLRDAGVKVYAANQRAGEFVVTFPQAYHSGFNHGINFNEAVNFALPEWLPFGRACARRYQEHQKTPVFSHDELLLTITQFSQSVKTALWLEPNLKQMIDRELEGRRLARDKILHLEEFNDPEDRAEEQYQCAVCKTLSYLSQITCACTENVACLEHHDSFCICVDEASRKLTLRTRYTDEEIRMIYQTVLDRTTLPQTWSNRLRDLLASSPTPPIKSLKAILADAESSGAPEQEAVDLANFVTRAEAWTSLAVTILTRKAQPRKRSRKSKGGSEDASNDPEYTLEDAEALLDELEMLGFQSPEVVQLSDAYRETRLLRTRVIAFLDLPLQNRDIDKAEVLLSDCKDKILAFPEVPSLEQSVEFLRLLQELDQVDDTTLTLDYVDELLQRAQANKMDPEHEYYRELVAKQELGQIWKQKAADILRSKSATIEELYEIANPLAGTPTVEKMRNTLQAMWSKAKDLEKTSRSILSGNRERKPTPEEVIAMINRSSDISIPVVDELKVLAKRGGRISSISKAIIKGTFQGEFDFPLDQLFATLCVWREETKRDLMMFNIPNFIDVDAQLTKHEAWLKTHPWSKRVSSRLAPANPFTEAFAVLQDVIIQTSTFDSDVPGFDCTCICKFPVVIESGGPNAVKCDSCDAKFHGLCISNSCPFCDHSHWNGEFTKSRNYSLSDLQVIYNNAPDISRNYSALGKLLFSVLSTCGTFSKLMDALITLIKRDVIVPSVEIVAKVRHIMRKLYVVQFRWPILHQPTTTYGAEFAVLHRTLAAALPKQSTSAPSPIPAGLPQFERPKFTFSCEQVEPGPDGCRCVCEKTLRLGLGEIPLKCRDCSLQYHRKCVIETHRPIDSASWVCPVCCGHKGLVYSHRQLRVRAPDVHGNRFVDYVNWILRRTPERPLIKMPEPRPNEPVIILTLISWTQEPVDPSSYIRKRPATLKPGRHEPKSMASPTPQPAPGLTSSTVPSRRDSEASSISSSSAHRPSVLAPIPKSEPRSASPSFPIPGALIDGDAKPTLYVPRARYLPSASPSAIPAPTVARPSLPASASTNSDLRPGHASLMNGSQHPSATMPTDVDVTLRKPSDIKTQHSKPTTTNGNTTSRNNPSSPSVPNPPVALSA